jgi:hypothetical protein
MKRLHYCLILLGYLLFLNINLILKIRILITVNSFWNAVNFRQGIIKYLVDSGYDVVVVTPKPYVPKVKC